MNLYLYTYLPNISMRWHHEGGAAVIASTEEDARAILAEDRKHCGLTLKMFEGTESPQVFPLKGKWQAKVADIFPDAGCC